MSRSVNSYLCRYGYLWLLFPFIALPLIHRGVSLFSTISFIFGLFLFFKNREFVIKSLKENRYLYLFLAFFIPIAISLLDSLSPQLTAQTLWRLIRFSSYAVIAVVVFQTAKSRERFSTAIVWLLVFYCIDAICQWLFDYNIYGYNPVSNAWHNRVRGVYGESYDLSYLLATLSPVIFFFLIEKIQKKSRGYIILAPIIMFLLIMTIFLGGARTAWISLVVSFSASLGYLIMRRGFWKYRYFYLALFIFIGLTLFVATQTDVFTARFNYSVHANSLNRLTSNRISLWNVAWSEFPNYWFNGVGVRGFDALYQTYPESYKIFKYMNHPHLQGLEVLIETGIVGFLPYLAVCGYILFAFFKAKKSNPWLLVAFLSMMPINSFSGLYEGNWLPVVFISLAIGTTFSNLPKRASLEEKV